ncbi:MAG: DNA methyltransferase, partial [Sulfurimonadaceae bacterium]
TDFDKKQGKRKKDGVFYTPEYITRYIVQNTLGRLCEEKKAALSLLIEAPAIANPKKLTKEQEKHKQNILDYRAWLENLKILDPACGSGAFLNQALEFLIREHTAVRDRLLPFQDLTLNYEIETAILEHNLYGVDINEDAVEIARLSLWLRTAQRGRTLTDLSGKIKCGNSLIDDKTVADNAFVWEEEFPEVFAQGGFDVVIGNPPYVGEKGNKEIFRLIKKIWKSRYEKNSDLLYFFFMKSIDILKENANFGFITTNYFLTADSAIMLRKELKERTAIYNLINFNETKVFESALGQHNIITIFKKTTEILNTDIINVISSENISSDELFTNNNKVEVFSKKSNELFEGSERYIRVSNEANKFESVFTKMLSHSKIIDEICFVNTGFNTGADRVTNSNLKQAYKTIPNDIKLNDGIFILSEEEFKEIKPEADLIYKCYKSSDIDKYISSSWQKLYVIWTKKDTDIDKHPNIKTHLEKYRKFLELKREYHTGQLPWFSQHWAREYDVFGNTDKIVLPYRSKSNIFSYSNGDYFGSKDILYLRKKDNNFSIKYLLALLNSNIYYIWLYYKGKRKGETLELYVTPISQIPIKDISSKEQQPFVNLVDEILETKPKIKEYKSLLDDAIKNDNFDREIKLKKEIETMENRVIECEKAIDAMVYKLYNLTDEEIKIVENSNER